MNHRVMKGPAGRRGGNERGRRRSLFRAQRHQRGAYSLVELLVCVVIIAVLTVISINSYQGALDQSDLKYAAPGVAGRLEALRREAVEKGMAIKVEFEIGNSKWRVTRRKGPENATVVEDLAVEGLIKRRLRFLRYEWPDGGDSPAAFTFTGSSAPQGGTVYFGTARAETPIRLQGGRVTCEYGIREPR